MGWAILFLVLVVLVIILSISLINWKMQIHKVNVQLNAILNGETKKLVTISWSAFMWQIFQGVTVHLDRDFIL